MNIFSLEINKIFRRACNNIYYTHVTIISFQSVYYVEVIILLRARRWILGVYMDVYIVRIVTPWGIANRPDFNGFVPIK